MSGDDTLDLCPHFTSEFLMDCAYMIPPVALGFIGSFILRITKEVENSSANNPAHAKDKPAPEK